MILGPKKLILRGNQRGHGVAPEVELLESARLQDIGKAAFGPREEDVLPDVPISFRGLES